MSWSVLEFNFSGEEKRFVVQTCSKSKASESSHSLLSLQKETEHEINYLPRRYNIDWSVQGGNRSIQRYSDLHPPKFRIYNKPEKVSVNTIQEGNDNFPMQELMSDKGNWSKRN